MRQHPTSEVLSAFLDGEAAPYEARAVMSHLTDCPACQSRLASLRQVAGSLRHLEPVGPPADLAILVRSRLAAMLPSAAPPATSAPAAPPTPAAAFVPVPLASPAPLAPPAPLAAASAATAPPALAASGEERQDRARGRLFRGVMQAMAAMRSAFADVRWGGLPPLRGALGTPLAIGMALLATALLLERGAEGNYPEGPRPGPEFRVSATFGDTPEALTQTTSQVAGREFVYSGEMWVQRGLDAGDARQPQTRVPVRSAQGRALLARYADLGMLLADGSPVVLRDHLETLEIWNGS